MRGEMRDSGGGDSRGVINSQSSQFPRRRRHDMTAKLRPLRRLKRTAGRLFVEGREGGREGGRSSIDERRSHQLFARIGSDRIGAEVGPTEWPFKPE